MSDKNAFQNMLEELGSILIAPDDLVEKSGVLQTMKDNPLFADPAPIIEANLKEYQEQGLTRQEIEISIRDMISEVVELTSPNVVKGLSDYKQEIIKNVSQQLIELFEAMLATIPKKDATFYFECMTRPDGEDENGNGKFYKANLPRKGEPRSVGWDVEAFENDMVMAGQTKLIRTGLKCVIPEGWEIQVRPRSGLSLKTKYRIANSPGTIDCGYLDEIKIIADNIGDEDFVFFAGDKICQFVFKRVPDVEVLETDDVTKHGIESRANERGEQGFGSTDSK